MSQLEIPFEGEKKYLEDIDGWEEKIARHDAFLAWKAASEKGELVSSGRASAEHFVNEFNKTFRNTSAEASYHFSNWQGYGPRGAYLIKIKLPDPASYRDILDEDGKRLPSREQK